jgi:hypothetical protein
MLGAHLSLGSNVRIGAGLGRRLTSAWGTAALRGTVRSRSIRRNRWTRVTESTASTATTGIDCRT